jgi:hypothetical protein
MLRLAVFEARACVLACQWCAVSVSCFQISYDLIVTLLEDVLCKCLCCFVVASYLSAGAQQSFLQLVLAPTSFCVRVCISCVHRCIQNVLCYCCDRSAPLSWECSWWLCAGAAVCVLRYDACTAGVCTCWMCLWMHCYQCQHMCASFACLFAYRYVCVTTAVWSAYCKVLAGASLTASRFLPPNSPGTRACAYASIPRLRCSSVSLYAVRLAGTSLR